MVHGGSGKQCEAVLRTHLTQGSWRKLPALLILIWTVWVTGYMSCALLKLRQMLRLNYSYFDDIYLATAKSGISVISQSPFGRGVVQLKSRKVWILFSGEARNKLDCTATI